MLVQPSRLACWDEMDSSDMEAGAHGSGASGSHLTLAPKCSAVRHTRRYGGHKVYVNIGRLGTVVT